jgi:hypothetical protein
MNNRSKKIFLALSIVVPFLLYSVYYYSKMVKNAPYRFSDFESITLKAGESSDYERIYNSKTRELQYLDVNDSLIKTKIKLTNDELLFLHRKAAELGFWDWPEKMLGDTSKPSPRYYLAFNYLSKGKTIEINASYNANPKLKDAALQLIKIVDKSIEDAAERK